MTDRNTRIQNERNEPTFYARIPKMCSMDLDPYELALYCNYKQTASEDGYCDKSNTKLAAETHMSVGKVKQAKKSLEDKKLITVEHRTDKSGIENQTTYIKMVDVWEQNHLRYAKEGGHVVTTPSHTVTTGGLQKNQGVVTKRPQIRTSEEKPSNKNQSKNKTAPIGAKSSSKQPKKPDFSKPLKDWSWVYLEQYACENPTIEILVALDGVPKFKNLATAGVARDAVEIFKELKRNEVTPERWKSLYTASIDVKGTFTAFRKMFYALPNWLKSEPPITIVKSEDDDMPKPAQPAWYPGMKSAAEKSA